MATHSNPPSKTVSKAPAKTQKMPPKQTTPSTCKQVSLAVLAVLAAVAVGAALYAVYLNLQLRKEIDTQSLGVLSQMKSIHQKQALLTHQVDTLNATLQTAIQERFYQTKDWMLLKAQYYLQLAQINAHWSANQQTTMVLLQQADALLASIHDKKLFEVRQAIAGEIADIQSSPGLDITGLLSRLDAAQNSTHTLSIKTDSLTRNQTPHETSSIKAPSTWHDHLKANLKTLEGLVIIRKHAQPIQPLLREGEAHLLRAIIQFNLQEAQWAVLQTNDSVYQIALNQAIQNINRSFNSNQATTKALLITLNELKQCKLTRAKPKVGASLKQLNQFIEATASKMPAPSVTGDNAS